MNDQNLEVQFDNVPDDIIDKLMGDTPDAAKVDDSLIIGAAEAPKSKAEKVDKSKENVVDDDVPVKLDDALAEKHLDELMEHDTDNSSVDDSPEDVQSDILKNMATGLVERGLWSDFDVPDDFVWNNESYGQLVQMQAQWKAQETLDEMLDQSGDYGKAIFTHIKNGGNPEEIISLFKESKRVGSFDISSESGQEAIVREYYTKLNWSGKKVDSFIKKLVDTGGLEEEAKESKDLLGEDFNRQVEETRKAQEEYVQEQKKLEEEFAGTMSNTIKSRKDIADKEKKEILESILKYDKKLPNGRVVNQFTLDFMKMQSDPDRYVDLVAFVRNPEKFIQKISKEKETEVAKKTWNFIKGNGSLNRNTGSSQTKRDTKTTDLKIDYKSFK